MVESVTRSVALVWRPARYAVDWAFEPSEVPAFDPSRGGDPFAPPRADVQHEELRIIFGTGGSLGGKRPSPPKWQTVDFPLDSGDDRAQDSFLNYPRLVRTTDVDVGERPGDNHPLQALAALTKYADNTSFMSAAHDAAERFGPLSFAAFSFSLVAWRHAAMELHSHLLLLKRLSEIEGSKPARGKDVALQPEMRSECFKAVEPLQVELSVPRPFELHELFDTSVTLSELRSGLADMYWSEFRRNLLPDAHADSHFDAKEQPSWTKKGLLEVGKPGQLIVRCGSRGWAFYELWQQVSKGGVIRECEGCGLLFQPPRKDARHCQDSCRVTSHRRRVKAAS